MTSEINTAILRISKRAEVSARDRLIQTFVDIGPLFTLLNGHDHQVIFGRRGTGKTHALSYLADARIREGDVVAMIDLRNIGSSAGLYGDESVALSERATRLLVDVLEAIYDSLFEFFVDHSENLDLSQTGPVLDELGDAITEVRVVGQVEQNAEVASARSDESAIDADIGIDGASPQMGVASRSGQVESSSVKSVTKRSGNERLYVNFGKTGVAFRKISKSLGKHRLWVILDEWSSVPLRLQPYLADLLRRALFASPNTTVKIGAIEHRSLFKQYREEGDYVGIELGADAAADIDLDDFMVFDNNAQRAKEFFQNLIARHVQAVADQEPPLNLPKNQQRIISEAFTERRAVEEFVRSCEGVPRDAIHILGLAAQRALDNPVSVQHIRVAAKSWYERDKEKAASASGDAQKLLHWIIDEVIAGRRARAFLLAAATRDRLIDTLYDARVLHLIKRGVSTHDQPGLRYDVFKIDYGCYVDLISTSRATEGLLPLDDPGEAGTEFVDVPPDDYRSIRRAILDLDSYYNNVGR